MRDALRIWKTSGTSNQSGQPYLDEVSDAELRDMGYERVRTECPSCEGSGETEVHAFGHFKFVECSNCWGRGWVPVDGVEYRHGKHEYDVDDDRDYFIVPAGTSSPIRWR